MALLFERIWTRILFIPMALMSSCWYLISSYWLWWMHRLPSAVCWSVIRLINETFRDLHMPDKDRCERLGKIHVIYENGKPFFNVVDPDLIKEMIGPNFNKFPDAEIQKKNILIGHNVMDNLERELELGSWEALRRSISLAFTPGKFRRTEHTMEHCCRKLCQLLISEAKRKESIDVKKVFDEFCMDMIFCTIFGISIQWPENADNVLTEKVLQLLRTNIKKHLSSSRRGANLRSSVRTAFMCGQDLTDFRNLIEQIIKKRIENKQVKTDFLQLLIESFPEASEEDCCYTHTTFLQKKTTSSSDLIAQTILFFTEGYQVTSSVLSLAVYNLALSPSHQERLRKEIKEALLAEREIGFDLVNKMAYMDQVVCETLRLYPPIKRLRRFAARDYAPGEPEVLIPKGSRIDIPLYAIHRNAQLYPDPEKFDTQRFVPKEWSKRHPYAFIPFGVGARNCIGMKFVLMEIKLCLVHLLKHMRFLKTAKTKVPMEYHRDPSLLEPKEVHLRLEEVPV